MLRILMLAVIALAMPELSWADQSPDGLIAGTTFKTGTPLQKYGALASIRAIPIDKRDPSVLIALLDELNHLDHQRQEQRAAMVAGTPVAPPEDEGDYLFSVLELVVEYKDPRIIRPLLPFITTGNKVIDAIAGFGELSVADVAAVAALDDLSIPRIANLDRVSSALVTLRRILDHQQEHPVSEATRRRIARVAGQRLTGVQDGVVVGRAAELGVKTGDSALIQKIRRLASDDAAVREFGVVDPGLVREVESRAATALREYDQR